MLTHAAQTPPKLLSIAIATPFGFTVYDLRFMNPDIAELDPIAGAQPKQPIVGHKAGGLPSY